MSIRTPLAGDDWGYCLIGKNASIIDSVISFYYSWSGRLFCELWGFTMATYKGIWDIVNPIVFLIIYLCIYFLSGIKRKNTSALLIIVMMLTVYFQIRTQTYTWIAGGNYSVSLCLSLLYYLLTDSLINKKKSKVSKICIFVLSSIFLIIIGLMIESIALTMIVSIIILITYCAVKNRKENIKMLITQLLFSISSFCITRLSPGSSARLIRDHSNWMNLTIWEKISKGYFSFIEYGFINTGYVLVFFSLTMILLIWFRKNSNNMLTKIINTIIVLLSIFTILSQKFFINDTIFSNAKSVYSIIFWPIYILNSFVILIKYMPNGINKEKSVFFLLIGGISGASMIMSPVNGARAYIYMVYYVILVSAIIYNSLDIGVLFDLFVIIFFSLIIIYKTNYYKKLYDEIEYAQEKRLVTIEYYQEHPEDEEVWIERFPENALHSIDIEQGDDYHFQVFKEYYNLPQNADKIVFYFDK